MSEDSEFSCGLDAAVAVVGGKWKLFIIWELSEGARRFAEVRRGLPGISEKVLTSQLRELERDGVVHREVYREVPPRVEYSLTPIGRTLILAAGPLGEWGEQNKAQIARSRSAGGGGETALTSSGSG
ncbi:winged helix-turn-helix transcriptional regulator [Nesterenkonia sp. K-15-9-6]|uniref:winged helix-turn-helix transcriptional regulator n=1 Tax=Nesterenkonia sp. K-15-9-6 TaxID=3093918 RepID=UPI0040450CCF